MTSTVGTKAAVLAEMRGYVSSTAISYSSGSGALMKRPPTIALANNHVRLLLLIVRVASYRVSCRNGRGEAVSGGSQ